MDVQKEFTAQCALKEASIMEGMCRAFMEDKGLPAERCALVRQSLPAGFMWRMVEVPEAPVEEPRAPLENKRLGELLDIINAHLDACGRLAHWKERHEYLIDPDSIADRLYQVQQDIPDE